MKFIGFLNFLFIWFAVFNLQKPLAAQHNANQQKDGASGRLRVESMPESGLDIFLDGKKTGAKTPHVFTNLSARDHTIYLDNRFYRSRVKKVNVRANEASEIHIRAEAQFGTLSIKARPEAEVSYDFNKIQKLTNIRLLPQQITLRATCAGFAPIKKIVHIRKQHHTEVELINDRPICALQLNIPEAEAEFTLTGAHRRFYLGKGSALIKNIPQGNYRLVVELEGFRPHKATLRVEKKIETYDAVLYPFTDAYMAQKKKFHWRRNFSFSAATLLFFAGLYFHIQNQRLFNDYRDAETSDLVVKYRERLQFRTKVNNGIFRAGAGFSLLTIYYQIRYVRIHPKDFLSIAIDPTAMNLAFQLHF